jgi:hypothetical protein
MLNDMSTWTWIASRQVWVIAKAPPWPSSDLRSRSSGYEWNVVVCKFAQPTIRWILEYLIAEIV